MSVPQTDPEVSSYATATIRRLGRTSLTLDFEVFGETSGGQDRATPWPEATLDAIRKPHHPPTARHEINKENHRCPR